MIVTEHKYKGYIGTYTKGDSKGIYSFTLDVKNAAVSDLKLAAELENPTYLSISADNQHLYSVVKDGDQGGVAAFTIEEDTDMLTELNRQLSPGAPPCYVSVSPQNQYLFTANYHKGTVESYPLGENGGNIHSVSSVIEHSGSGPDPRQEKPHTHYSALTPDEKYVAVAELGTDKIYTYEVNDGILKEANSLSVAPGSGPRHLTFHPNGKYAYVMTEFSSKVIVLSYRSEDGSFTELQSLSTLPDDFKENNQGSAIHISSDGRFVYAGNRGHNSIAVFSVDEQTGKLQFVERISTEGDWPRDFALDPSETFLLASNQESGNLVLYSRDTDSGKLTLLTADIAVPHPVCVKFLHA
ncbi:lactonase family protein [Bacillus dakarensis]|uniref:lactonase family protein n=1 Tax=Robertmurraya dakarensis TaxID=1926278 RepID=UPI00098124B7|nr:lactonase family protein [Bacillus dakarensis]